MKRIRIHQKKKCPCCGQRTLESKGDFEICPICKWEDDPVQAKDHDFAGGANSLSLNEARAEWKRKLREK